MTTLRKNVFEARSRLQWLSRVTRGGRGKQAMDRLAANPLRSSAEMTRLEEELNALVSTEAQADLDAAFAAGDFYRQPPARTWPPDVFTTDTSSAFSKSLTAALGGIRK